MPYEVNFTDEFGAWWDGLAIAQQEDIAARVELLEQEGPALRWAGLLSTESLRPPSTT